MVVKCQEIIGEWLSHFGLELSEEKTRITHTLKEHENNKPGFDFLGFNIRQYPVGKRQSGKNTKGELLGFKTIIKPSKEKVKEHYEQLTEIINSHKAAKQQTLIVKLAPIIKGWANYYRTVCSQETFSKMNHLLYWKLKRWGDRRHPNKSQKWVTNKYWRTKENNNWVFGCVINGEEYTLPKHSETKIIRHTKVKSDVSFYNGDTNYWASRMGKHPGMKDSIAKLLKKQKGKCNFCGLTFKPEDQIERDHIVPQRAGGDKYKDNLQLLHKHCHDAKTKNDLITVKRYKIKKAWEKVVKEFQNQFEKLDWQWKDDLPTLV